MPDSKSKISLISSDIPASVVVFLVAIPLCLGIALASGAPLISGIISGVVGGIVVGLFSGSSVGVSGPAAGLAIIVLHAIQNLGSFEAFLMAVVLAGMIQVAMGYAKAGIIGYYFPSSVISGLLAGIGCLIFFKQIPHAVGFDRSPEGEFFFNQIDGENTFSEILIAIQSLGAGPTVITAVSLTILLCWELGAIKKLKFIGKIPPALVAVVTGICLAFFFKSSDFLNLSLSQFVQLPVIESYSDISKLFTFPDFSSLSNSQIYTTAIILAIVASIETLLCVEATDKLDPQKRVTPASKELKAQGLGNIVSGLIGGLPVTQVIVRSSANIQAGGQSKLSAILHGCLIAICAFFLPELLNQIPLATLAAILLVVGGKLASPTLFKKMYHQGMGQFIPFMITVLGIIFTDLLTGVAMGMCAGVLGILYESYQLPFYISKINNKSGSAVKLTLTSQVTFLSKATILKTLDSLAGKYHVEIDATMCSFMHHDIIEIINNFKKSGKNKSKEILVYGVPDYSDLRKPSPFSLTVNSSARKYSLKAGSHLRELHLKQAQADLQQSSQSS